MASNLQLKLKDSTTSNIVEQEVLINSNNSVYDEINKNKITVTIKIATSFPLDIPLFTTLIVSVLGIATVCGFATTGC